MQCEFCAFDGETVMTHNPDAHAENDGWPVLPASPPTECFECGGTAVGMVDDWPLCNGCIPNLGLVACMKCGSTDLPLHVNGQCPECSPSGAGN